MRACARYMTAALLLTVPWSAGATDTQLPKSFTAIVGSEKGVCRELVKRVRKITKKQFLDGEVQGIFDDGQWRTTTFSWRDNSGRMWPQDFRYRTFDIDNDGKDEVILSERAMGRYSYYDLWRILPFSNLPAIESGQLSVAAFNEAEMINQRSAGFRESRWVRASAVIHRELALRQPQLCSLSGRVLWASEQFFTLNCLSNRPIQRRRTVAAYEGSLCHPQLISA